MATEDIFDHGVSYPFKVHDFEKSREEINAAQKRKDKYCLAKINKAETQGIITPEAGESLRGYFADAMYNYGKMFRVLNRVFSEEESIKIVDPITKEVLLKNAHLKHVTPNTCAVFKVPVKSKNSLDLILPGFKNIDRAIDKVRKDGKYKGDSTQLRDVLRISVVGKRLEDIMLIEELFSKLDNVVVDPKKTKDKFCGNDVKRASEFNEKNFRNKVFYVEMENGLVFEVQLKIKALEKINDLTHDWYKKLRKIKEDQSISDKEKVLIVSSIEKTILQLYNWGIEKHNQNEVLEKIARMEERFEVLGFAKNRQGLYNECLNFLNRNFLVRPKHALLEEDPLPNLSEELKKQIGFDKFSDEAKYLLRDAGPEVKCVYGRYKEYIVPKYICVLKDDKKKQNRFSGPKNEGSSL